MSETPQVLSAGKTAEEPPPFDDLTGRPGLLRRLLRDRAALIAIGVMSLLALAALFAPLIFMSPREISAADRLAGPSLDHLLGTDELGRDLLSRVANAGRVTLGIGAFSTLVAMVGGTIWGFVAGLRRGIIDEVLMRIVDAAMAIPLILFALIFIAALGSDRATLGLVIGLLMIPLTARVARSAVLTELAMDYYRALVAVGVPRRRILFAELLPNAAPALLAQASLNLATAIMVEASLSFLGLGVQPPDASWGTLLLQGYGRLFDSVWYPIIPALVIIAAVASLNTIGDRLQHLLGRSAT